MPKLGFDMAEGKLIRWLKAEGEAVEKGQVLAEIETDKATVEVEAPASGLVRRQLVSEGTSVPVGTPIAILGTADEAIEEAVPAPAGLGPQPGSVTGPAEASIIARVPVELAEAGHLPAGVRA
ncbi:MAG: biotin/lipoyl-containing protein [Chloroflexota bacterium]